MLPSPLAVYSDRSAGFACWSLCSWLAARGARAAATRRRSDFTTVTKPPTVQVIQPEVRKHRPGRRPAQLHRSYERTSIYPKLTAYIEKWNVDIGDKVKKGDVLATLFVPELVEDFGTKKATVKLDKQRVELARKMVKVAEADVKAAEARLDRGQGDPGQVRGRGRALGHPRSSGCTHEVNQGVVDPQILLESTNQLKSSAASRDAAKATITKAEAELLSKRGHAGKGQGRRLGRRGRPGRRRRARRSGSRHGSATSRSPRPSTA